MLMRLKIVLRGEELGTRNSQLGTGRTEEPDIEVTAFEIVGEQQHVRSRGGRKLPDFVWRMPGCARVYIKI